MYIRAARPEDAARLIALFEKLYSETKFMLYEPGEAVPGEQEYTQRIEQNAKTESGVLFVAEVEGEAIGAGLGIRGSAKRTRHSLFLVIGVLQAWSGRGVGRSLLQAIEHWAIAKGIHRLGLTVIASNHRAISLYERVGFEREGLKRHALNVDGDYIDELYMSKLVAP